MKSWPFLNRCFALALLLLPIQGITAPIALPPTSLDLRSQVANNFTEMLVDAQDYTGWRALGPEGKTSDEWVKVLLHTRFAIVSAGWNSQLEKDLSEAEIQKLESERHPKLLQYLKDHQFRPDGETRYVIQEVKGKYGGHLENSVFLHFGPVERFSELIEEKEFLAQLGAAFNQDSIIWSLHGNQLLIHTTGPNQGKLYSGIGVEFKPEDTEDNFTHFPSLRQAVYFTLNFDWDHLLTWDEFVQNFQMSNGKDFEGVSVLSRNGTGRVEQEVQPQTLPSQISSHKPLLIITRGIWNYWQFQKKILHYFGEREQVRCINKDAHILQVEKEYLETHTDFENTTTREEAKRRNLELATSYMRSAAKPHLVVSAVHLNPSQVEDTVKVAMEEGYQVLFVRTGTLEDSKYLTFLQNKKQGFKLWEAKELKMRGWQIPQIHEDQLPWKNADSLSLFQFTNAF